MPDADSDDGRVHEHYRPEEDRALSDAVLEAIERFVGEDLSKSETPLYDSIDPDALDSLFRHEASPDATVRFDYEDVEVELAGNGGVDIYVGDAD